MTAILFRVQRPLSIIARRGGLGARGGRNEQTRTRDGHGKIIRSENMEWAGQSCNELSGGGGGGGGEAYTQTPYKMADKGKQQTNKQTNRQMRT